MIKFRDKLLLGIISSISCSIVFSIYELYFSLYFPLTPQMLTIVQLLVLSIPFYFFLLHTEDSIIAMLSGFIFHFFKSLIIDFIKYQPFCLFNSFAWGLSFFILGLAIAFHREVALTEARVGLLSTFFIFFAFIFSAFIILTIESLSCPIGEIEIYRILRFLEFSTRL